MTSPEDVLHRLLALIAAGAWDDLPSLYAEDALVEQPFAAPAPVALRGRAAIAAHFAAASRAPFDIVPRNVRVHPARDPELVVAEFDYDLRHRATGRVSTVANVQLLRVRDGRIVHSRDYHDHRAIAAAAPPPPAPDADTAGTAQ